LKTIFISAGDPSGDLHASRVMKEIKRIMPEVQFTGFGGEHMIAQGLDSIISIEEISVVGFWEVAKKYLFFRSFLKKCSNIISPGKIDLFLPVDFPGFNLRLAKYAKTSNIPVIYYIAPQLWAWGESRAKGMKEKVDILLTVFPFETDFFDRFGINTKFVGHPLLDDPEIPEEIPTADDREDIIALLPGSRKQEVARILPVLLDTIPLIKVDYPDHRIAIARSSNIDEQFYRSLIGDDQKYELWDNSRELLKTAKAGVVKTGTSNLEAALCGMPFVMVYLTSLASYYLAKNLINLSKLSIINILARKEVVKELIQNDADKRLIAKNLDSILSNDMKYDYIQSQFKGIREMLGESGAAENVAEIVVEYLK
jgi:lipid-A-disaccharide synthase